MSGGFFFVGRFPRPEAQWPIFILYTCLPACLAVEQLYPTAHLSFRETSPQQTTTREILEGCKNLAPELLNADGEFDVLAVQVGLRPSRRGGPRVETEIVDGKYNVVHSYGHGAAGYVFGSPPSKVV